MPSPSLVGSGVDLAAPDPSNEAKGPKPLNQGTSQVVTPCGPHRIHPNSISSAKGLFLSFKNVDRNSVGARDMIALHEALINLGLEETLPAGLRREAEEMLANLIGLKHHMKMAATYADRLATMAPAGLTELDTVIGTRLQEKKTLERPRQILKDKIESDEILLEEIRQRIFINKKTLSSLERHESAIDVQIQDAEEDKRKIIRHHTFERSAEAKSADYHLIVLDALWERMRNALASFAEGLPEDH